MRPDQQIGNICTWDFGNEVPCQTTISTNETLQYKSRERTKQVL